MNTNTSAQPHFCAERTVRILRHVVEYGIAAILLLQCNTVWMTIASVREQLWKILPVALFVLVVCGIALSVRRIDLKKLGIGAAIYASIALYLLILFFVIKTNKDVYLSFLHIFMLLALYQIVCYRGGSDGVLMKYRTLLCFVAVFSVVMWLLCTVFKWIPPSGVEMTSWNDTAFMDTPIQSWARIYFQAQPNRNTSIFTEGPMAALQYSLALLVDTFLAKKPSLLISGILAVALLTTMTTTGYLVLLLVAAVYLWRFALKKGWLSKKEGKMTVIALGALGAGVVIAVMLWKLKTASGSIRFDDMRAGVLAFWDAPLFGNGCNNLPAIQQYMSPWRHHNMGYSSGLLWILSDGGLWLGAVYLCPIVLAAVRSVRQKRWGVAAFAACLLGIFLISVFQYTYLLSFLAIFLLFWRPTSVEKK